MVAAPEQASSRPLSEAERLDWLRLSRTEHVGPVTFRQLLARFGTAAAALEALPDLARRGGRRAAPRIPSPAEAERELEAIERIGATTLGLTEPGYPEPLAATDDAPPLLILRGRSELLARPAVALVGARNASANGRTLARTLARDCAAAGFVVASGLARGIDAAAHEGALDGGTIAAVAGGLDVCYPPENRALQQAIGERGLLVGEQPPGLEPQARHFPRRNRIISGLSLGVVVVEAALRSGSLITARLALEQGREVGAVPGSPLDPRARGCNALLRQGAILVEEADDLLRALMGQGLPSRPARLEEPAPPAGAAAGGASDAARAAVVECLGPSGVAVDEVLRRCQLSASLVSLILMELELAGRLERQPGGRVALIGAPD
ncbi:DNA processing protein [Tistlia consotensis]|uniref:DNA processing protein n=1 Tax=Tistlia consotensis USBA 355 TaxID=560819 RepID=A0A1Y6BN40_9PROT|nr:DNA processing protein [Tistlia consotensis USBA 355]SNR47625.1 DNA processing protein [Tistlia consotensis]